MALTAGGVPTPADLAALTTSLVAGQKLRVADLTGVQAYAVGDRVRASHFSDLAAAPAVPDELQVVPNTSAAQSGSGLVIVAHTPPGLSAGDLRLFMISVSNQTITTPDGLDLEHVEVVASTRRLYLFSCVHDPDFVPTFVLSAAANHGLAQCGVRGYDGTTPLALTPAVASNATAGNTLTGSTVTTPEDGCLLLGFYASISNATADTLSTPSGMTPLDAQPGNGFVGHSVLLAAEERPTAGATGTRVSTSGVSAAWAAMMVVIAPGLAGGTGGGGTSTRPYFAAGEWYWRPIPASPVLDANSANIVSVLATQKHAIATDDFAAKLVHPSEVTASTPRYDIAFANAIGGSSGLNWGPDPFGSYLMAIPDGTETQIPPGDAFHVDGHVAVGDDVENKAACLWQAVASGSPNRIRGATWGGICDLDGDGRESPSIGISTGAGLSRFAGPIRESEIAAGVIPHALLFGSNAVTVRGSNAEGTNFVYPATNTDGENESGAAHTIREGARVQLDPSLNLAAIPGITPVELIVGTALQHYGAICADETSGDARMAFVFERAPGSTAYAAAGATDNLDMTHIPWSSLRVLARWDGA